MCPWEQEQKKGPQRFLVSHYFQNAQEAAELLTSGEQHDLNCFYYILAFLQSFS